MNYSLSATFSCLFMMLLLTSNNNAADSVCTANNRISTVTLIDQNHCKIDNMPSYGADLDVYFKCVPYEYVYTVGTIYATQVQHNFTEDNPDLSIISSCPGEVTPDCTLIEFKTNLSKHQTDSRVNFRILMDVTGAGAHTLELLNAQFSTEGLGCDLRMMTVTPITSINSTKGTVVETSGSQRTLLTLGNAFFVAMAIITNNVFT